MSGSQRGLFRGIVAVSVGMCSLVTVAWRAWPEAGRPTDRDARITVQHTDQEAET